MNDYLIIQEAARVDPEWAVIDRIWTEFDTPYGWDNRLDILTPGQRAVYALTWIRAEVTNGGFDQCFFNPTAYLLPEAVEGARTLDLALWVRLLERAAGLFDAPFPREREVRQRLLEQFTPAERTTMDALDDELFDLEETPLTSLDVHFRRYIDDHPEEFFREADSEEQAIEVLLVCARSIINKPQQRNLVQAREILEEARWRSKAAGLERSEGLAKSLLVQLPDLTT